MSDEGRAEDRNQIMQLKARYFRMMDTKDWDGLAAVFTEDVEIDMTNEGGGVTRSVTEYLPFLRKHIEAATSVHHGHMPEITFTSTTAATGIWAMEDMLWWPEGSSLHGYGHYHETYTKVDGEWRIATMTLTRLRRDRASAGASSMFTASSPEREIYRKIVELARAMDDRDWAAFADITLTDATADLGTGLLEGRDEIVRLIRSFLDECGPTQHLVGNVLIDVDGDTAHSRAYVCDTHLGTGDLTQTSFRTLGDYHDDWVKVDDGWRLSHRTKHMRGAIGSNAVLGAGPGGWADRRP